MTLDLLAAPFLYENKLAQARLIMDEEEALDLAVAIGQDVEKAEALLEAVTGIVTDLNDLHTRAHALVNEIEERTDAESLAELDLDELDEPDAADDDEDDEDDEDDVLDEAEELVEDSTDDEEPEDMWADLDRRGDGEPAELDFEAE